MVMELQFKSLTDRKDVDLIQYITDYTKSNADVEIYVGCDSQVHGRNIDYGIVVILHKPHAGGHVLYTEVQTNRIKGKPTENLFTRLWQEVEFSLTIAERLRASDIKVKYIDVDLNPDPRWGSNTVLRAAMGYVESMGYIPRCKPDAWSASYCADKICK